MTSHRRGRVRDAAGAQQPGEAGSAQGEVQGGVGAKSAGAARRRSELRERTGWERAPALHGYTCLIPRIGAVCVGVRPTAQSARGGAKAESDRVHAIWVVATSRPDSLLSRAMFRAAVQLVAYVAPEVLVRVPEDALAYYLNTPLSGAERDTLLWSKLTPAPLRQWAEGMRR